MYQNSIKYLFKITLLGVSIFLASNSSCQKDAINGVTNVELNNYFDLALNKKVVLGKELIVDFVKVLDSRCPINAKCIWAGNVTVSLTLSNLENMKSETTLCIGQCESKFKMADTIRVNLNQTNYTVVLKDVKPYPGTKGAEDIKAILLVKKD